MKKTASSRSATTKAKTHQAKTQSIVALPKELTTVTPLTKLLAFVVIIGSVVMAFTLGRLYEMVKTI